MELIGQTAVQLSKKMRVKGTEVSWTVDLKDSTEKPCPERSKSIGVVFVLVHGVLETKHLLMISSAQITWNNEDIVTSA